MTTVSAYRPSHCHYSILSTLFIQEQSSKSSLWLYLYWYHYLSPAVSFLSKSVLFNILILFLHTANVSIAEYV